MRPASFHCALAIINAGLLITTEAPADEYSKDDIVMTHELRTAFYEHAPANLINAMTAATNLWCTNERNSKAESRAAADSVPAVWLCGNQGLQFLRNVYVTGDKGTHGLVCEKSGTTALKYFGMDLVEDLLTDGSCVSADTDGTAYKLYVTVDRDDGDA